METTNRRLLAAMFALTLVATFFAWRGATHAKAARALAEEVRVIAEHVSTQHIVPEAPQELRTLRQELIDAGVIGDSTEGG